MTAKKIAFRMILMTLILISLLALLVLLYGCGCPHIARPSATAYEIDKSKCVRTLKGACILLNNNLVSNSFYDVIDYKIDETESCLKEWYANRSDVMHRVYNWKPPARSCYTILLPDDWTTSCDGEWQVFGQAPQESCNAKGFKEDPNCPCKFRGLLQDGRIVLVPPDLKFLRIEVVEWLTGYRSSDLWATPELVKCGGF